MTPTGRKWTTRLPAIRARTLLSQKPILESLVCPNKASVPVITAALLTQAEFRRLSSITRVQGEKPAELPFEVPTRYELIINLKTAKAMGLAVSDSFLLLAGEVIE